MEDSYVEEGGMVPEGVDPSKLIAMDFALRACSGLTEQLKPDDFMELATAIHQFIQQEPPMEIIH